MNPDVNHSSWLFVERTKERNSLFLLQKTEKLNLKRFGALKPFGVIFGKSRCLLEKHSK